LKKKIAILFTLILATTNTQSIVFANYKENTKDLDTNVILEKNLISEEELISDQELMERYGTEDVLITEEVLLSLNEQDFTTANEILNQWMESTEHYTIDDINIKSTEILNQIYTEKQSKPTTFMLPEEFYRLNDEERRLIAIYPGSAIKVFDASRRARKEAEKWFSYDQLDQGNGDAFRHSYWNICMVMDLSAFGSSDNTYYDINYGIAMAKRFADAHEYASTAPLDTEMDLYNNNIGRNLAKNNLYESNGILRFSGGGVDTTMYYIKYGYMKRIVSNRLVVTNSTGCSY